MDRESELATSLGFAWRDLERCYRDLGTAIENYKDAQVALNEHRANKVLEAARVRAG